jgi:NAD+ synthase
MRKLNYEQIITNIQEWIRDYIDSANANGVVVGISGGIDSAVTTTLCVNALGKKKVIGLSLPCSSIPEDLRDAESFAQDMGIQFLTMDLTEVYQEFLRVTSPLIKSNQLSDANLKPRLRMMTNYFFGQSLGNYLVVGTSNRSELAIGYFTKYGDGGVDFEPIGNLYKYEVRELAKILKIPNNIILKPPSAGLWEGQTDENEIGMSYDALDEILYRIDNGVDLQDLNQLDVTRVKRMMKNALHKNRMPPVFQINQKRV